MYNMPEHPVTREELKRRLEAVDGAKICLIGDFCLDIYWHADMRLSELSRETPHYPLPIVEERFSPGGAGFTIFCCLIIPAFRISASGPGPG